MNAPHFVLHRRRRSVGGALLALVAAALAGCASAPAERFYRLPMPALAVTPAAELSTPRGGPLVVAVAAVGLPELFDRPQLVTGRSGAEVQLWETQRWAEPLRQGLGRALAARLARELAPAEVLAWPLLAAGEPAFRVSVNVLRFDAELGRGVDDEWQWSVKRVADGAQRSGRSLLRQPVSVPGHEALVAAHGVALDGLSRDVAQAVRDLRDISDKPAADVRRP